MMCISVDILLDAGRECGIEESALQIAWNPLMSVLPLDGPILMLGGWAACIALVPTGIMMRWSEWPGDWAGVGSPTKESK